MTDYRDEQTPTQKERDDRLVETRKRSIDDTPLKHAYDTPTPVKTIVAVAMLEEKQYQIPTRPYIAYEHYKCMFDGEPGKHTFISFRVSHLEEKYQEKMLADLETWYANYKFNKGFGEKS